MFVYELSIHYFSQKNELLLFNSFNLTLSFRNKEQSAECVTDEPGLSPQKASCLYWMITITLHS